MIMSRLPFLTLASAALILPMLAAPEPALAQRVNEIIVYGTDPCPRSTDDEVVVCARKPESERFRIPEKLRSGGSLQSRQASRSPSRSSSSDPRSRKWMSRHARPT